MSDGSLRVLDDDDLPEFTALIERDPLANLFVASRVSIFGLFPQSLNCAVYGYYAAGELVAACHVGTNLVIVGDHAQAMKAFCAAIGPRRSVASIVGPCAATHELYGRLCDQWGESWKKPREFREHQPLMVIRKPPLISGDTRVRRMDTIYSEAYTRAAVAMYTEEVGITPIDGSNIYQRYVRMLIQTGRALGAVVPRSGESDSCDRVWFKSDIGSSWRSCCQIQGVWLDPVLRGRGLAAPAMAQVVILSQQHFSQVSLYVNDFNTRARKLYAEVGFTTVGELATVLY